jgi:hypothetical protein
MTGGDGVEVVACTPRRLAGRVSYQVGNYTVSDTAFGDVADNQRCVGGAPTVITHGASSGGGGTATAAAPGEAVATAPQLIERPFVGKEEAFNDELCKHLGLMSQEVLGSTVMVNTGDSDFMAPGTDMHIRIWSDVPNDLDGVVFMVRQLTSTKSKKETKKEWADIEKKHAHDKVDYTPKPKPETHGPPPAPLVEERPQQPFAGAMWIDGYWSWTGQTWGWVAGFWRDDRYAMPAPRIEVPGDVPHAGAIWIGGTWTLRAGQYVWITGRWR